MQQHTPPRTTAQSGLKAARELVLVLLFLPLGVTAVTRYVDPSNLAAAQPYTDWTNAATTIQDAVDISTAGDEVVVTNGVYASGGRAVGTTLTNRVAVDRAIAVRSVNGPLVTLIQGMQVPSITNGDGAIRCVYLTNGASLSGFTLTNGATLGSAQNDRNGGGVCGPSSFSSAVVSNCTLAGNSASSSGGGAYGVTLVNSMIRSNTAANGGGACYAVATGCLLSGNAAGYEGGGADNCTLTNCILLRNSAAQFGGGGANPNAGALYGCLVVSNYAKIGGGAYLPRTANYCSIIGNSANQYGGVQVGARIAYGCIIYYNSALVSPNYDNSNLGNCCTVPSVSYNNITNEPLFVDAGAGDFRLAANSPCINSGNNSQYRGPSTDLDGNQRIVNGMVDIGAYEFQGAGSAISYAWLQQYGLPTDGSADAGDPDEDRMSNWQEWWCGTDPTNALSVLTLLAPTGGVSGVTVIWQSVTNRAYTLERATNLASAPAFSVVRRNISGQTGTTSSLDTQATSSGPYFYRVSPTFP